MDPFEELTSKAVWLQGPLYKRVYNSFLVHAGNTTEGSHQVIIQHASKDST